MSSAAWIDPTTSFIVTKERSSEIVRAQLGEGSRKDPIVIASNEQSDEPTPTKKESKIHKCKCLFKRVSKVFRKEKQQKSDSEGKSEILNK